MSEKASKDKQKTSKPETPTEKKPPETVQLSAEELRKISGGTNTTPPPPRH
jgi:hypothetical protein